MQSDMAYRPAIGFLAQSMVHHDRAEMDQRSFLWDFPWKFHPSSAVFTVDTKTCPWTWFETCSETW